MPKIVAVGEEDSIRGFLAAGVELRPVGEGADLESILLEAGRDPDVALILVTEPAASRAPEAIKGFRARPATMLMVVPTHLGSGHMTLNEIKRMIETSIGVDLVGGS